MKREVIGYKLYCFKQYVKGVSTIFALVGIFAGFVLAVVYIVEQFK